MQRPSRLRPARSLVLLVIVAAAAAAACESGSPAPTPVDGHPATLAGTSWIVSAVGGVAPPPNPLVVTASLPGMKPVKKGLPLLVGPL